MAPLLSHQRHAARGAASLARSIEPLESRQLLAATVELVRDINEGAEAGFLGQPLAHQGTLYFAGGDPTNVELWRTDPDRGARRVRNINKGESSFPANLTAAGDLVYFSARNTNRGNELWRTDGTLQGTELTQDLLGSNPQRSRSLGIEDQIDSNPSGLLAVGKQLLFNALFYPDNRQNPQGVVQEFLWSIGPNDASPRKIIVTDQSEGVPRPFAAVNGNALVVHTDSTDHTDPADDNFELWRVDPQTGQSQLVKDLAKGFSAFPTNHGESKDRVFFTAYTGKNRDAGRKLCVTDGTRGGTRVVADVGLTGVADIINSAVVGNDLYFSLTNAETDTPELWTSDGTKAGTRRIIAFDTSDDTFITGITRGKNHVFFSADDGTSGQELWATDIETGDTFRVSDLNPGEASSSPGNLTRVGKWVYFSATSATTGTELWRTDGNKTRNLTDESLNPGALEDSDPGNLTNVDGTLYFGAFTPLRGVELYRVVTGKNPDEANVADASRVPARLPTAASPFNRTPLFSMEDDGEFNGSDPYLRPWPSRPAHELAIQHPSMSHGIQQDEMTPPGSR